mmetsp:Transcript_33727/g.106045  ORF Transcript_33727/g.106045 Transcript_33727/m.106045 type:complete len:267 (+) Transcript_33727:26-826(+)
MATTREPTTDESAGDALSENIAASSLSRAAGENAQETAADGTVSGVADAATDAAVGGDAPPLSKRAQKRQLKQQSQVEKRRAEKQAKKEAKRAKREQAQAVWEAMPAEEKARVRAEAHARGEREQRRQAALREKEAKAAAAAALSADGADGRAPLPSVVIDLSFEKLMTEREIASLAQQISYSYSSNRRAAFPTRLVLSSLGGATRAKLTQGFEHWPVVLEERSYLEVFPERERLIYLSSESEELLAEKMGRIHCPVNEVTVLCAS